MLMPVGQGVGFTWAHDRVRDALQRVSGMSSPMSTWEYGSLTEARDIANRNGMALRSVGERECRSSRRSRRPRAEARGRRGPGGLPGRRRPGAETTGGGAPAEPVAPAARERRPAAATGGTRHADAAIGRQRRSAADACTSNLQMQAESAWRVARDDVDVQPLRASSDAGRARARARRQDGHPDFRRMADGRARGNVDDGDRRRGGGCRARDALHGVRAGVHVLRRPARDQLRAVAGSVPSFGTAGNAGRHDRRRHRSAPR